MKHLVYAELLKLRTARSFWLYVAAALAFVPVTIALTINVTDAAGAGVQLDSSEGVRNVMAASSAGSLMVILIGILVLAGEFRHRTATSTFLISPDRRRVVGAKLAATSLVGLGIAAASSLLTLAIAIPWLSSDGVDVGSYAGDVGIVLVGALVATALSGVLGVGLAALVPHQNTAVVGALIWMTTVEALLVAFKPDVGRWLPGGASAALTETATANGGMLPMWAGALVFAGYGMAFAAAGTALVLRRDVA